MTFSLMPITQMDFGPDTSLAELLSNFLLDKQEDMFKVLEII